MSITIDYRVGSTSHAENYHSRILHLYLRMAIHFFVYEKSLLLINPLA